MSIPSKIRFIRRRIIVGLPALLLAGTLFSCGACVPLFQEQAQNQVTLLSYNVQNLFDYSDNGSEYPEFDPGNGKWGEDDFHAKAANIARVLREMSTGGADIIALQEVENRNAVELMRDHYLTELDYRYLVVTETAESAIQLAVLSRFPITDSRHHRVQIPGAPLLREIQEVQIKILDSDLYLFNNHWKSKRGGEAATEPYRQAAAAVVRRRISAILAQDSAAQVLVVGDLNSELPFYRPDQFFPGRETSNAAEGSAVQPVEEVPPVPGGLYQSRHPEKSGLHASGGVILYSPWNTLPTGTGSYAFRGSWEQIDHCLFTAGLYYPPGLRFVSFSVGGLEYLYHRDGFPLGWQWNRQEGFSDHLPLLLVLELAAVPD